MLSGCSGDGRRCTIHLELPGVRLLTTWRNPVAPGKNKANTERGMGLGSTGDCGGGGGGEVGKGGRLRES